MDKNWHYIRQPKLANFEDRPSAEIALRTSLMVPSHPSAASELWHPKKCALEAPSSV